MNGNESDLLMIHPDTTVMGEIESVYALSIIPDDFLRASGEIFAKCDSAWKDAKNNGKPIDEPIADFLCAGLVHLDALELCSLYREALMVAVSILISIDLTRIDTVVLGKPFIKLHEHLLTGCARLCKECENDEYAKPHADAILCHEAFLFLDAFKTVDFASPKLKGFAEGCRKIIEANDKKEENMLNRADLYVDIFARLHAIDS